MAQRSRRGGRVIIYLALILILLIILAFLFLRGQLNFGAGLNQQPPANTPIATAEVMEQIVVTTQHVPRGTVFTTDVLTTINYPVQYDQTVPSIFFHSVAEVTGKVAAVDLDAHVPLTRESCRSKWDPQRTANTCWNGGHFNPLEKSYFGDILCTSGWRPR